MSQLTTNDLKAERAERADRLLTTASGWGAVLIGVLGLHRWIAVGGYPWQDQWARVGLILALALFIMWVWGYWGDIVSRTRQWVRGGGLNAATVALGLVVCLVVVNTIARRSFPLRWDLTKNQRFTLSPRSRGILKGLKNPVKATVFIPNGARTGTRIRDLFNQYRDASEKFTWTRVDPLVDQKTLLEVSPKKLAAPDFTGAVLEYNGKREDLGGEIGEKDVTSAILKMTRDTQRKILFTRGHGEPDVTSAAAGGDASKSIQTLVSDLKQDQNWAVDSLDLYGKDAKTPDPSTVAALVIAGPERPFAPEEEQRVNEFLDRGGHVLLLLNPRGPSFSQFTAKWGIKTGDDLVLDRSQNGLVVVDTPADAPVAVRGARRILFQPMRSVTALTPAPAGITVTPLLKSGPMSEDVPNVPPGKRLTSAELTNSKAGPTGIAALAEKSIGSPDPKKGEEAKKARLVVVGDSVFIADQLARLPSFYNEPLASGLINYLGEEEALVAIPPRDENTEQAFLTPDQGRLFSLIHIWDFPLLALVLALIVYFKRR